MTLTFLVLRFLHPNQMSPYQSGDTSSELELPLFYAYMCIWLRTKGFLLGWRGVVCMAQLTFLSP